MTEKYVARYRVMASTNASCPLASWQGKCETTMSKTFNKIYNRKSRHIILRVHKTIGFWWLLWVLMLGLRQLCWPLTEGHSRDTIMTTSATSLRQFWFITITGTLSFLLVSNMKGLNFKGKNKLWLWQFASIRNDST